MELPDVGQRLLIIGVAQKEATVRRARIPGALMIKRGIQRREFAQLGVPVSEASVASSAKV
ncbi:hypothetical protein SCL_0793 [Sulfuricaulis limicola]|uniref:Uncharacterized protein n=1 Tax=Sulfuricaulis limicola TaxID=1620215 RepID=A0A1B4XEB0_9GAMM|nr:hypothetical protein SCL_0793 [Sulfuricaulis limicola]